MRVIVSFGVSGAVASAGAGCWANDTADSIRIETNAKRRRASWFIRFSVWFGREMLRESVGESNLFANHQRAQPAGAIHNSRNHKGHEGHEEQETPARRQRRGSKSSCFFSS